MCSNIERVPSARLRRLHRRHRGQREFLHMLNLSLHDEPRRSSRRLCGEAAERAGHDEFAALQYGIGEHRFLPEVLNPDLHNSGGRIDADGRCVSCGSTAQARVPPAVRPSWETCQCSISRGTAPQRHISICGQAGDDVGLGIHSFTGEDLLVYVSPCRLRAENSRGLICYRFTVLLWGGGGLFLHNLGH